MSICGKRAGAWWFRSGPGGGGGCYDFGDLAEVRAFLRELMAVMGLDEEIEDVD